MSGRPGLADQVVVRLLDAVADGSYPPDSRLPSEALLAADAQVSRLTLREAVRVLRDKGVLRVEQGRGTFVNPPERWSVLDPLLVVVRAGLEADWGRTARQLTETRHYVEVGAAELAAARRSSADLTELREALRQMQDAHGAGDVAAFSAADVRFHDAVAVAARNPVLAALLQPVRALVEQVRVHTSLTPDMRSTALLAHSVVLDAIEAADPVAARQAMADHIAQTHRVIERLVSARTVGQAAAEAGWPARPRELRELSPT